MQSWLYDDGVQMLKRKTYARKCKTSAAKQGCNVLVVHCMQNPDYEGAWLKSVVEQEIKELCPKLLKKKSTEAWIEWVLLKLLEPDDQDSSVIEAICIPNVRSITFHTKKNGIVKILKTVKQ